MCSFLCLSNLGRHNPSEDIGQIGLLSDLGCVWHPWSITNTGAIQAVEWQGARIDFSAKGFWMCEDQSRLTNFHPPSTIIVVSESIVPAMHDLFGFVMIFFSTIEAFGAMDFDNIVSQS